MDGRSAEGLLATEQRHDLVGAHARHILAGSRIAESPDQPLPPALGPFRADDLEDAALRELPDFCGYAGVTGVMHRYM